MSPTVTVLMPVYNGEAYLREAIESILAQTYTDFEFLIINDASTDNSVSIIESYSDPRIKLLHNESNQGLIFSLNRGISKAKGKYIARFDCDDCAMSERLAKQVDFLEKNLGVSAVGSKVLLMDSNGNPCGHWDVDIQTITPEEIRTKLPRCNCIAHPSVMMRKSIIEKYMYDIRQTNAEDYDLWLRLAANGEHIEKLDSILLKYRVHPKSVTQISNQVSLATKNLRTKYHFLVRQLLINKRLNSFSRTVLKNFLTDAKLFTKRKLENLIYFTTRFLFLFIGAFAGRFYRKRNPSSLFFFFPYYHTGGAEQVHADIVEIFKDEKPWIIITATSKGTQFKNFFNTCGNLYCIDFCQRSRFFASILHGFWSTVINRQNHPVVFGANSEFFYQLIPYLKAHVKICDLIHAFGGQLEHISIPHINRLDHRVVISPKTRLDFLQLYKQNKLPSSLVDRIHVIENKVEVPPKKPVKDLNSAKKLCIIYVGRGTKEKRVHLVGKIAHACFSYNISAEFTLVGDLLESVNQSDREYGTFTGEILNKEQLAAIYNRADILIITSISEGFPMTVMEGMAYGVVPITTDVGGLSHHIHQNVTGYLIANSENEKHIVEDFTDCIKQLSTDRTTLGNVSETVYNYAKEHFNENKFQEAYKKLLGTLREQNFS